MLCISSLQLVAVLASHPHTVLTEVIKYVRSDYSYVHISERMERRGAGGRSD